MKQPDERLSDRIVLLIISAGLIIILLSIVWGLFLNPRTMPNWAENVLVSVATACALKLGDCLSTLVALAGGRQVERLGSQLASTLPADGAKVEIVQPPNSPVPVEETRS